MIELGKCKKIFLDFDGVIVDSNKFKELAIENSIFKLLGLNQKNIKAINYFNENAGISRKIKLKKFYDDKQVLKILELYAEECHKFFSQAKPSNGLKVFIDYLKINYKNIKLYVLSGGEDCEIKLFLEKNFLLGYFEDILASKQSKVIHLRNLKATANDIFIGDSHNDLKAATKTGIKFILLEEYKSLNSFPSENLIKNNAFLQTNNFESLMDQIIL